jgi:leucyl-tRNA synthetase
VAAKTGGAKSQFEIMKGMGISAEEIPKFADPSYWLEYFPPYGLSDLKKVVISTRFECTFQFGVAVDWRRSFITTDRNPFYDRFIQWQFNTLKKNNRVKFGNRPTIYSR